MEDLELDRSGGLRCALVRVTAAAATRCGAPATVLRPTGRHRYFPMCVKHALQVRAHEQIHPDHEWRQAR
jgi:hypothetical protein